jgi:hypothetical protein
MNPHRHLIAAAAIAFAFQLAGCVAQRSARIEQNSQIFAALDPVSQQRVRNVDIDLGFHAEHVYMAIGKPSRVAKLDGPEGAETWIYNNFVFGGASAIAMAINNPGTRYQSRLVAANAPRSGGSLFDTRQTGPQPTIDDGSGSTVTLYVDMVDGVVVRIRVER